MISTIDVLELNSKAYTIAIHIRVVRIDIELFIVEMLRL